MIEAGLVGDRSAVWFEEKRVGRPSCGVVTLLAVLPLAEVRRRAAESWKERVPVCDGADAWRAAKLAAAQAEELEELRQRLERGRRLPRAA